MACSSNISLPREKCMKCKEECDIVLSSSTPYGDFGNCDHKFCQSCIKKANTDLVPNITHKYKCPCCHASFFESIQSIDEAI